MLSFTQKVRISCLYVSFPNETHENKHCRPQLQTDNSAKEKEPKHNLFGGHVDPSTVPDGRGSRGRRSLRSPGRREEEVLEVGLQPHRVQVTSAPRMRYRCSEWSLLQQPLQRGGRRGEEEGGGGGGRRGGGGHRLRPRQAGLQRRRHRRRGQAGRRVQVLGLF